MKRLLILILLAITAISGAARYTTQRFDVLVNIRPDGVVEMRETIALTFTEPQRGLIRKLPYRTRGSEGQVRTVGYTLNGVTQTTRAGTETAETSQSEQGGDWSVRIGSRDRFLEGPVTYTISYSVSGAMTPFESHETLGRHTEFLWNVLPTDWPTSIPSSQITVRFPEPEEGPLQARILVGPRGTRRGIQIDRDGSTVGDQSLVRARFTGQTLEIQPQRPLGVGESVTMAISLPGSTVTASAPDIQMQGETRGPDFEMPQVPAGLSFLGFAPLLAIPAAYALACKKWVPSAVKNRPMVVRYEPPPGVDPSICGLIIDGNVDQRDIVAGIVSLAQKGGIRMHHLEDGQPGVALELLGAERLRNPDEFELTLYRALEPYGQIITPDMLRGSFGPSYNMLVSTLHSEAHVRGFMEDVAGAKSGLGCLLFLLTGVLLVLSFVFNPCMAIVSAALAFGIGSWMIGRISPLTSLGHDTKWHLQGLYEFIERANQKELNYMANRMPDQALFEELLPYAVAFNLVRQWTDAFQGIDLQMPDWYAGAGFDPMTTLWTTMLISDLMDMDHSYGGSMMPDVSSFGSGDFFSGGDSAFGGSWNSDGGGFDGGFSGGDGGGGGGGDSW